MLIIEIQNAFVVRSQAREFLHMFHLWSIDRPAGPLNHRRKETFKCGTTMKIEWHKSHDSTHFRWKVSLKEEKKKTRCWNIFRLFQVFNWKHMWRWLHLTKHYVGDETKEEEEEFAEHYSKFHLRTRRESVVIDCCATPLNFKSAQIFHEIQSEHIRCCKIMCQRGRSFFIINGAETFEPWKDKKTNLQ